MRSARADDLAAARFLLLTTFRKDGTPVPTAVWAAPLDGGEIGVWSAPDAGKVKRIRRSGTVEIGECDRRGNPTGPAVPATARILDPAGTRSVLAAINRKYGIAGRLATGVARLRRGKDGAAGLAITPG
ncbi:PPOX class F420-dependent oxidoreductase [Pseudonocardia sp. T1-2H]|uniref:PPOX class F420-dependent oxidoreductase n=1 Tax=Pseudonocardia sp. T1-2H TaxID=3128899 RepID=UPI003100EB08